ncbi:MAG: riboflavin synthase, partial [Nitrospiraceae bacterium]
MFTGIIEEMGAVTAVEKTLTGMKLRILASTIMDDLKVGDSVSVNGACLTVVSVGQQEFTVDISAETLSVTSLG